MKYRPAAGTRRGMAILVPYPAQGHVTPMLKLASMLVQQGDLQPVLIIPDFIHHRISHQIDPLDGIVCLSILSGSIDDHDDDEEKTRRRHRDHQFLAVEEIMENNMSYHLETLLLKLVNREEEEEEGGGGGGSSRVACMVVDLLASYAIGVGNRLDIRVVGFWPASFAAYRIIASIPHMLDAGIISDTGCPVDVGRICLGSGQPRLKGEELPWLIGSASARSSRFKFWNRTIRRSRNLPYLLVNSFKEECFTDNHNNPNLKYPSENYPQMTIVPIQPSCMDMDSTGDVRISPKASFWEEDLSSLDWLNQQTAGSVLYISFGSWVSPLGESKIKTLALALEAYGMPFLWVLGPVWIQDLPDGYAERVSKKGLAKIVSWAPQMEVLQHQSVRCYLSHCGWNSTIEAIYCKKPLLCYPIAGDQFVNCWYIVNKWRIGIKIGGFGEIELEVALSRLREDWEMLAEGMKRLNESFLGKVACQKAMDHVASFVDHILNSQESF